MAIVLYAPALALSQSEFSFLSNQFRKINISLIHLATGLNIWLSVVSIGVICTFYSSVVCCIKENEMQENISKLNTRVV